jgi:hypothetical protein
MSKLNPVVTTVAPSAEHAISPQGASVTYVSDQVSPAFVERPIGPNAAHATSLVPSAEQAMLCQFVAGALRVIQVNPKFVERWMVEITP